MSSIIIQKEMTAMRCVCVLLGVPYYETLHVQDAIHKSREDYVRFKLKLKMNSQSLAKIRPKSKLQDYPITP